MTQSLSVRDRRRFASVSLGLAAIVAASVVVVAQSRREFDVVARRYAFSVAGQADPTIRVTQNDLVHIRFSTDDIPHSFTIEEPPYRIMRRAEPGRPVAFDFRADQPGRFRFFCNLTAEPRCKEMHGTLVVERVR